jgi:glucose-induced degradation protein 4
MDDSHSEAIVAAPEVLQQPTPPQDSQPAGSADTYISEQQDIKRMDMDEDTTAPDMLSPMSADGDKQEESELPALASADLGSPSMGYDFSNIRVCGAPPSFYHL